uniref:Uncharacterized protein n=1 Tax=Rhizophora mucronata TaxID=61149 RepID=A0A2P2R0J3_RHIMU
MFPALPVAKTQNPQGEKWGEDN